MKRIESTRSVPTMHGISHAVVPRLFRNPSQRELDKFSENITVFSIKVCNPSSRPLFSMSFIECIGNLISNLNHERFMSIAHRAEIEACCVQA